MPNQMQSSVDKATKNRNRPSNTENPGKPLVSILYLLQKIPEASVGRRNRRISPRRDEKLLGCGRRTVPEHHDLSECSWLGADGDLAFAGRNSVNTERGRAAEPVLTGHQPKPHRSPDERAPTCRYPSCQRPALARSSRSAKGARGFFFEQPRILGKRIPNTRLSTQPLFLKLYSFSSVIKMICQQVSQMYWKDRSSAWAGKVFLACWGR